jgi:hypothetical protein
LPSWGIQWLAWAKAYLVGSQEKRNVGFERNHRTLDWVINICIISVDLLLRSQTGLGSADRKAASFTRLPLSTTVKAQLKGVVMHITLTPHYETEVYVNRGGQIVFFQSNPASGRSTIFLTPEQMSHLMTLFPELIAEAKKVSSEGGE